mgnify:CR=1 FL=1
MVLAIGLLVDVMALEKRPLGVGVDPVTDRAELVGVGAGEPVTQRHVTVGGDAHQTKTRAAGQRLACALVQLLDRIAHVAEAVMPTGQRGLQELVAERSELSEHLIES